MGLGVRRFAEGRRGLLGRRTRVSEREGRHVFHQLRGRYGHKGHQGRTGKGAHFWGWTKKRRELWELLRVALIGFESIQCDLYAESYDAATIWRRLTELERETAINLPSYVFTLLNRREAAHRLNPVSRMITSL